MNAVNNVYKGCQYGLDGCGKVAAKAATEVELLEKLTKIGYRILDVFAVKGNLSAPFAVLSRHLKQTAEVFESFRFFGAMQTLICPNKEGVYFLKDPKNSWQKCADRVFLAGHTGLKMLNGMDKFNLIHLGTVAKVSIGHLPIFKLTYDGFIILSSFFGSWDAINHLPGVRKHLSEADYKIEKWEFRPTMIALVRASDQIEIAEYQEKCITTVFEKQEEIAKNNKKLAVLQQEALVYEDVLKNIDNGSFIAPKKSLLSFRAQTPEEIREKTQAKAKEIAKKIGQVKVIQQKYEQRIQRCEDRLTKIAAHDYKGLADELSTKNIEYKSNKWQVSKYNAEVDQNKMWLKIANAVGKIAVVTLALTLMAFNFWTAAATLTLLGLGIVVDSIGSIKILYEDYRHHKPMPVLAN